MCQPVNTGPDPEAFYLDHSGVEDECVEGVFCLPGSPFPEERIEGGSWVLGMHIGEMSRREWVDLGRIWQHRGEICYMCFPNKSQAAQDRSIIELW